MRHQPAPRSPRARAALAASAIGAAMLAGVPAHAQDRTAAIDSIFSFATPQTPGCAVGVSRHGKVVANRAYGLADVERQVPLGQASLFDIGSTQKQFTAAAMLLLVEDGRVSLSDDIRKHLPQLPDYGHKVTIDNLLTHTAGIRDWTGLLPMAPQGTDVLSLIMRQRGLNFVPGEEWSYSSSGFELAKEIVARASGMSFAEFTRRRLFEPLGMKATAYVPDIMQAGPNAAMGYQKDGAGWKPYMRLGNNRGGGAIVSTIGDILTWNDALASGRLGTFVTAKIQEPVALRNGRRLRYARGLMVDSTPGGLVVSHSGSAAGFSTWMGRVPEHGLAVTVACNFDPVSATALGGQVADLFLPPADPSWKRPGPTALAGVDVSGRAGLFFEERTGEPMRLGVNNGRLVIANGSPLVPVSASSFKPPRTDLFFRSQDAFELTFTDADHLEIRSMEGQVTRYRRAQAWTPTAADLQAVDGRYESPELGSVIELAPGTNAVTMRLEAAADRSVELAPVDRDTYMFRMMIVRLRRDASGKVTGFDYGNPVVRGIAFRRVGDRRATASATPATTTPAATPTTTPAAAPVRLESLVGFYEGPRAGAGIDVTLENGTLYGVAGGGAKLPLVPQSGTTYYVGSEGAPRTVTFTLGADGRATALVFRAGSSPERTFTRVR